MGALENPGFSDDFLNPNNKAKRLVTTQVGVQNFERFLGFHYEAFKKPPRQNNFRPNFPMAGFP